MYLSRLGVQQRLISTGHPRSNGLVERYNGVIKMGLRRVLTALPEMSWSEALPDVLMGIRTLPTRLGYSPFLLVFKQEPESLARDIRLQYQDADYSLQEEEHFLAM